MLKLIILGKFPPLINCPPPPVNSHLVNFPNPNCNPNPSPNPNPDPGENSPEGENLVRW